VTKKAKTPHLSGNGCPHWEYDEGFQEYFCMCEKYEKEKN
jgi:hypothetical protein